MSKLPVGILLAAGKSSRFGSNKLLYPVIDNTPMIISSAAKLVSVLPNSIVVINHALSSLTTQLEETGIRVVINQQAEQGMGSSIACGVRASESQNSENLNNKSLNSKDKDNYASGWLIMLADMPYLKTQTIQQIASQLNSGVNIVAPSYNQKRGHPVGFSKTYKNELLALNEDIGARELLKKYHAKLELVSVDDKGVLIDIDQTSDLL